MPTRLPNALFGAAAAVLVLAGCADSQAGTPIPGGTATSTTGDPTGSTTPLNPPTTSGSANRHGAPPVTNPLNVNKFLTQPCAALTAQQLESFNLPTQGKPDTESAVAKHAGPFCTWLNSGTATGIGVGFLTGNKNGLADLYRENERGTWKGYWEPTTVTGYPGVFHFTTDARPQGSCNLAVGISDTLTFRASTDGRLKEQSCDLAKQVAAAVVETLKRGG